MKRVGILGILTLIIMVISVSAVSGIAFATSTDSYILHKDTPLYADQTLSTIACKLPQNQKVAVLEEITISGEEYFKINVGDQTGYVSALYVYRTTSKDSEQIYRAKALSNKIGGSIDVYSEPREGAGVIRSYVDGSVLTVASSEVEGYHVIIMEDGVGYVKDENITTSISYNERIAIVIAIICVVAVVLILVITYYKRNSNYFKSKRTSK